MNFAQVCRTCMRSETLKPIFNDEDDHEKLSKAIYIATGVQVLNNDHLPQNICLECLNNINNTLRFRKQCTIVETRLLQIKDGVKLNSTFNIHETISVKDSNQVKDTILDIDYIPKEDFSDVLNLQGDEVKPMVSMSETDHCENNIKLSVTLIESHPKALYDDNIDRSDDDIKIDVNDNHDDIKQITTESIERVNLKNIFNETENSICEDDEDDMKIDFGQVGQDLDFETTKNNITLDKTHNELSISLSDINLKTDDIIKKTTKKINSKRISTKTKHRETNNETIEIVELPYNVLSDEKCGKMNRVVCKMCTKELSIRSIDSHMARCHPGADARKVKCELCDNHVLKEKLNRHIVMMHGNTYKCGYCKSEFNDRSLLLEHVQTCTAKKRKASKAGREMTQCDVCAQKMQKASLRMHKATKHAGLRPVCEHCGGSFGNKLRLDEHRRAKHGYDKFHCTRCQFTSASSAAMQNHERRHRGEKPFVCETCDAKFHAAYLLAQHRHSHRTERNVKCDLCPASFKANNSLHMHRLACHGARMFTCGLCARAYRCRHYALRHLRLVHRHAAGGDAPPLLILPHDVT